MDKSIYRKIEENKKLGYYRVNDEIFFSKPAALMRATELNVYPKWIFNNREFASFNWSIEPVPSLRELYRIRAQQLRDSYDYIRIEASGGGDSTTAIFSFLLNGIHLDEVIFRYPKQTDKGVTDDPYNTKAENTLSEWKFAGLPLFKWISENFPETKTTFYDYSENLLNDDYMKDESWVFTTRDWFQPGHGIKHDNLGNKEQRNLADTGKKICALYGVDKPKLTVINGAWYLYFMDVQANHPSPVVGDYTNITTELFYWTPDLPEMICKQAHMVRNYFEQPQNHNLQHLFSYPNTSIQHRTAYEWLVKSIIYPDYDLDTWQTAKPTNSFYNEMDHWFYTNLQGTEIYTVWENGLKFLTDKIDDKFFSEQMGQKVGFIPNTSPFYYIGSCNIPKPKLAFDNKDYKTQTGRPKEKINLIKDCKLTQILI